MVFKLLDCITYQIIVSTSPIKQIAAMIKHRSDILNLFDSPNFLRVGILLNKHTERSWTEPT